MKISENGNFGLLKLLMVMNFLVFFSPKMPEGARTTLKIDHEFSLILRLRQGFLDHLDTWPTEALDRATSVVTSKTEELNSELDLKVRSHCA